MSRRLAVATIVAGVRLLFGADGGCLKYEPARVTLNGTLVSHQGLRGFWAVKPDYPICTIKGPTDPAAIAHSGVAEVQLILMGGQADFDRYRPLLGRKVSVSGSPECPRESEHPTAASRVATAIETGAGTPASARSISPSLASATATTSRACSSRAGEPNELSSRSSRRHMFSESPRAGWMIWFRASASPGSARARSAGSAPHSTPR